METRLGDGGYVLSAGQEQLVAFARILVRDPHVVILDEATARMDPVTEARVQRATERLLRDRIGIVIAHRLSSVRRCDEVVVLADGAVRGGRPAARVAALRRAAGHQRRRGVAGRPAGAAAAAVGRVLDAGDARGRRRAAATPGRRAGTTAPPCRPRPIRRRCRPRRPPGPCARSSGWPPTTRGSAWPRSAMFLVMVLLGLDGSVLPWLWADLVDGARQPVLAGRRHRGRAAARPLPLPYYTEPWFPEWWVRQMLRISLRLVYGQTGPRRVSAHTPAEVVAQGGDTERVVMLADNLIDQFICAWSC